MTHLDGSIAIKWLKKTMLKKMINSTAAKSAEEGMAFWAQRVHLHLKAMKDAVAPLALSDAEQDDIGMIDIASGVESGCDSDGYNSDRSLPAMERRDTVAFSFALIELMMEDIEADDAAKANQIQKDEANVNITEDQKQDVMVEDAGYSTSMDSRSADRNGNTPTTDTTDEHNEPKIDLKRFIDDQYSNTAVHLGCIQKEEWHTIFTDEFIGTPSQIFRTAWSEDAVREIHAQRGSSGLNITEWTEDREDNMLLSDQPTTWKRELEYICPIKDAPPFMPSKTEVYETQRFRFYGERKLVFDVSISTPNVKYGDHFVLLNKYVLDLDDDGDNGNKTKLESSMAMKWVKKTMLRKVIAKKAQSDSIGGVTMWSERLHKVMKQVVERDAKMVEMAQKAKERTKERAQKQKEIESQNKMKIGLHCPDTQNDTDSHSFGDFEAEQDELVASIIEDEQEQNKSDKSNGNGTTGNQSRDSVEHKSTSQSPNSDRKPPKDDTLNPLNSIDECYAATTIHIGFSQKEKWESMCNETFDAFPTEIFHIAFSVDFVRDLHASRGSTNLVVGPWTKDDDEMTPSDQPPVYKRKLEYVSPIKDAPPFMPSETEVFETQRVRFYGQNKLVYDVSISTPVCYVPFHSIGLEIIIH